MGRLINSLFALGTALTASLIGVNAHAQAPPDEARAWQDAQQVGTPEAFQTFLELYPDGHFAQQAFTELADSFATAAGDSVADTQQSASSESGAGNSASPSDGTEAGMY